jgi:hypothetical protein
LEKGSQLVQEKIMSIQLRSLYPRASALPITCSVAFIFASASLFAAASVQSVPAALSESSAAAKPAEAGKIGARRIFDQPGARRRPRNRWV